MRLVPSVHAGIRSTAVAMSAMRVNTPQYGLTFDETFDELSVASESQKGLNIFDELGAAALVVGTACGGGFMALPHTTSPAGALPSSLMLIAIWAFLLLESLLMSDLVLDSATGNQYGNPELFQANLTKSYLASTINSNVTYPSLVTIGRRAFGDTGGMMISAVFVALMVTNLVAQLAKGSAFLGAALPMMPPSVRLFALAAALSLFTSAAPIRVLSLVNGMLTLGFVAAMASIFTVSSSLATPAFLVRSDWTAALPSMPTLMQLHAYHESIPTVVEALRGDRKRVRRVIWLGSLTLLAIQLGWSLYGIALVPPAALAGGVRMDPVDVLLKAGGGVAIATAASAICAVTTTILGMNRALHRCFADTVRDAATSAGKRWVKLRTIALYSVCTLGPAVVASRASAKQMFFGALDFGGAYPVTFLWGLAPPLIALSLRSVRNPGKFAFEGRKRRLIYVPLAIALSMMGYNLLGDATRILAGGAARWQ